MNPLQREKYWPYAATAVVALAWHYCLYSRFPEEPNDLMLATGTASAVLIGFLATAKAIILGLTGTPVFKALKDSGYHTILFRYLFEATATGLLLLVLSVVGFFFPKDKMPLWFDHLWVIAAASALFTFMRVVGKLFRLIEKA